MHIVLVFTLKARDRNSVPRMQRKHVGRGVASSTSMHIDSVCMPVLSLSPHVK